MEKFKFLAKDKISRLPKGPGVYCFKRGREFLYLGKATDMKDRVKNHFQRPTSVWEQTLLRQGFGGRVGFIKTNSEIEALILEANLIKKHQPKYNVIWRDDKNYFYVAITKEDFPRIFWTHQPTVKNKKQETRNKYIGPFVDGAALKQTLKILRKVFPYRTCKTLPKRPCLWYQLGRCLAPCTLKSKLGKQIPGAEIKMKRELQRNAKNLLKFLTLGKTQVLKDLKKEMKKASASQDFEKAAKIRDQITALEKVLAHFRIFEPQPPKKEGWSRIQKSLCQILKTNPPKFCLPDLPSATRRRAGEAKLRRARIEAYDVSNIQGQEATGSMVTFVNGKPDKNFYRKFKVRVFGKPNDIAMLKECLERRFKHPEWPYPDLILIDGGKAQLNAALSTRNKKQKTKNIKVVALAKKKNELYLERRRKPILLKTLPREIFNLILQLRDEAHRFALIYHRKLRKKYLIK